MNKTSKLEADVLKLQKPSPDATHAAKNRRLRLQFPNAHLNWKVIDPEKCFLV